MNQYKRALKYAGLGWAVSPVYEIGQDRHCACAQGKDCTRPGKHPHTENGVHDATTDPSQIKKWWGKWPNANIGLFKAYCLTNCN
jgi:putative DNA primase/helicase